MTVEQLAKVDAREADAIHALMHCENEQACTRCNPHNGYMDAEQAEYYSSDKPRLHHRRARIPAKTTTELAPASSALPVKSSSLR